jgi:hypothetical protein
MARQPRLESVRITPEMIAAGEAVLDRAFAQAELPASWFVSSALGDIYTAMVRAKPRQVRAGRERRAA